jgi:hypothetical protein
MRSCATVEEETHVKTAGSVFIGQRWALWLTGTVLIATGLGLPRAVAKGSAPPSTASRCQLTQGSGGDPFYKPNAPVRSRVGTGFVLTGVVRSGIDCSTMRGTRVELWLRGPDGQYDDIHRGTVITDGNGRYRFESNFPGGGAPHIHVRVAAPGYRPLETRYVPRSGAATGVFDLVLEPEV